MNMSIMRSEVDKELIKPVHKVMSLSVYGEGQKKSTKKAKKVNPMKREKVTPAAMTTFSGSCQMQIEPIMYELQIVKQNRVI